MSLACSECVGGGWGAVDRRLTSSSWPSLELLRRLASQLRSLQRIVEADTPFLVFCTVEAFLGMARGGCEAICEMRREGGGWEEAGEARGLAGGPGALIE